MSSRIVIDPKNLVSELLGRERLVRQALVKGAAAAARRGRAHLVRKTPKDQGQLKAGWRDSATGVSRGSNSLLAEITNDAPYAGVVEMGARPHPVSEEGQQAIREWVRRHLADFVGRSRARAIQRRRAAGQSDADAEVKEIAGAIIWRIRKYGTPPTYFIRNALPEITRFAAQEVARELEAVSKRRKAD